MRKQLRRRGTPLEQPCYAVQQEHDPSKHDHQKNEDRAPEDVNQPSPNRDDGNPEENAQDQHGDEQADQPENPLAVPAASVMVVVVPYTSSQSSFPLKPSPYPPEIALSPNHMDRIKPIIEPVNPTKWRPDSGGILSRPSRPIFQPRTS